MVDSFRISLLYHILWFIHGMVRVFSGNKYLVKVFFIFTHVTYEDHRLGSRMPDNRFDTGGGFTA